MVPLSITSHREEKQPRPLPRPYQLGKNEARHVGRTDAGEGVGQGAGYRDRRIGERGGRGEPIGGGDVRADRERRGGGGPQAGGGAPRGGEDGGSGGNA